MSVFTDRLKEILDKRGVTQRELAETIGKTEASVSRYVNGERIPKVSVLCDIAQALNCQADYLIGNDSLFDCGSAVPEEDRYGCEYCNIERKDFRFSTIPIDMGDFGRDFEAAIFISRRIPSICVEFGDKQREPIIAVHSDKIKYCPYCGTVLKGEKDN